MKKIDIAYQPTEIQAGNVVKLSASPADNTKFDDYRWSIPGEWGTPDRARPDLVDWNTRGLKSDTYKISVEAKLAADPSKGILPAEEGYGSIDLYVAPRSLSAEDVEGLA